jgi:hypothetical protein
VLRTAWKQDRLTLCLGAGVSQPYGIPGWSELVLSFLVRQTDRETWCDFYPHFRKALSEWMMQYFSVSPLTLARLFVKGGDRNQFMDRLRRTLYRDMKTSHNTSLDAVVAFVRQTHEAGRKIAGIITLNYDDLLEQKLKAAGLTCSSVIGAESDTADGIAVIHAHGFLPERGPIPNHELILAETDYHRVMSTAFHWATVTLGWHIRVNNILFVGVSLRDPSIRRLLDGCRPPGNTRPHTVLCRDYQLEGADLRKAVEEVQTCAMKYGRKMRRHERKLPGEMKEIMQKVCETAQEYDRDVLKSFGVRAIRLRTYDDIRALLEYVARPGGS